MANTDTDSEIDWMQCELIEKVPVRYRDSPSCAERVLFPTPFDSYDLGETIDELREGFPSLSVSQIQRLIQFAHAPRGQPNSPPRKA